MQYPNLEQGNCRNFTAEADIFNPPKGQWRLGKEAVQICLNCEVREPCLEYALETKQDGVWGGLTEYERRQLRSKRSIA